MSSLCAYISTCTLQYKQARHNATKHSSFNLFTLFSCIKKIVQSCDKLGCRNVAPPSTEEMFVQSCGHVGLRAIALPSTDQMDQ